MTEAEWLSCTDPNQMLRFLQGRATNRKLRLFAVACCYRVWDHLTDPYSWQAVQISERYADGRANDEELVAAFLAADRAYSTQRRPGGLPTWHALDAARLAAHPEMRGLADGTATAAAMARAGSGGDFWQQYATEQGNQCVLLRDIFGNPFRPLRPRSFPAHVLGLAQTCYDAFPLVSQDLLILADALEELGEEQAAAHCREPLHARGCHVLDWVLGRLPFSQDPLPATAGTE